MSTRARRAGGITRSRVAAVLPIDTPDHPLADTRDISKFLADSINQLRRGQFDPKVANAVGYLASVLLRSLEQGRIEERLAHLESIVGSKDGRSGLFEFQSKMDMEDNNAQASATAPID